MSILASFFSDFSPVTWLSGAFVIVIILFLIVDLGLLSKSNEPVSFRSASLQSAFWVCISLIYAWLIYVYYPEQTYEHEGVDKTFTPKESAFQFLTAYITEYSLSVDNIFVFILIFRHFKVEPEYHHKVLYYGVLGAVIFRGIFIGMGNILVAQFHWILYIFGAILVFTGVKMLFTNEDDSFDPEKSWTYKQLNKRLRFSTAPHQGRFTMRQDGRLYFTSLLLVVLLIETTDIIFAVDSIPAVFSITQDPFIIYTSNIFAVMGLRAMYFMLEGIMHRFQYLQKGISFILIFIGGKMLWEFVHVLKVHEMVDNDLWRKIFHFEITDGISLSVILIVLAGSIVLSMVMPPSESESKPPGS